MRTFFSHISHAFQSNGFHQAVLISGALVSALNAICVKCLKQTLESTMHLRLKNKFRIGVERNRRRTCMRACCTWIWIHHTQRSGLHRVKWMHLFRCNSQMRTCPRTLASECWHLFNSHCIGNEMGKRVACSRCASAYGVRSIGSLPKCTIKNTTRMIIFRWRKWDTTRVRKLKQFFHDSHNE